MKIKRSLSIILAVLVISIMSMNVYAIPSLDDVTSGNVGIEEETIPFQGSYDTDNDTYSNESSFFNNLSGEVDFTRQEQSVTDIQGKVHSPIAIIFQMVVYGLTLAVTGKILMDLFFIMIPSCRFLFIKAGADNQNMSMAMGGNMAPPPMTMGGIGGMGAMGGMSGAMGQAPIDFNKYRGVSEAAIKAVEANKQPSSKGALGTYFRDTIVECVFAGVLLVLALSGVLQQAGFYIGDMIVNMARGMM